MHNFDFVKPSSIAEAAKLLGQDGAQPLSGGQTLMPTMKQRLAAPSVLVSLTGIAELQGVCMGDGGLHIGGATAHSVVAREAAKYYPALATLAGGIGDPAVRSRGTIGGSIANNDPSACYPSAVLGGGATVVTNKRKIAADDYFQGMFTTALEEGEFVTGVTFPIPEKAAYVKFNQPASRFALTGVFVAKFKTGVRVAVTGASNNGVFRWAEGEAALSKSFSADAVKGLAVDDCDMISDLHGTAAYRANLVRVLTGRAVTAAH
jgi:carbon-monoxide dehydrogenase medium subunit